MRQTRLSPVNPDRGRIGSTEIEERIRKRAYEIYEERGRKEGHALDHRLEAKAEVLDVVKGPGRSRSFPANLAFGSLRECFQE
jgi:hypothetical protein